MKIRNAEKVASVPVDCQGARRVEKRVLIGPAEGAPTFNMRQFTLGPGGHTPRHRHDWEHEVFVLSGTGKVSAAEAETDITAGDCVFVQPNELHQFKNTGQGELKLLCLVPKTATA